jgi:hypothetical protein
MILALGRRSNRRALLRWTSSAKQSAAPPEFSAADVPSNAAQAWRHHGSAAQLRAEVEPRLPTQAILSPEQEVVRVLLETKQCNAPGFATLLSFLLRE